MQRRAFLALIGGTAATPLLPALPARTQQSRLPTIGFLGTTSQAAWTAWTAAFVKRLQELGWVEGRTVAIEYRWAGARNERYEEIATESVRLKVDVIVTSAGAVPAVKQATSVIPVVFTLAPDPVASGFVASMARPGGNVTGLSTQAQDLAVKRLEILREVVPNLRRLAILANAGHPTAPLQARETADTARTFGLDVTIPEIRRADDFAPAIEAIKGRADADQVRAGDQPHHRQGARHRNPVAAPVHRRRGDRVARAVD
jgi:putative tryptophan/tyrosine transport system substrate-binding protein